MTTLNFGAVAGLTEGERRQLSELVQVFEYHQSQNAVKDKYYEGHVTLGDVNLGIALPQGLRNLEVEMDTLKRQKAEAQSRRNEAELALRENVRQITALTASVESARLVQKENQLLLSQVVEMKKDRTELEQKLKDATKTISDLQTQLAKIREGIDLPENIRRIQDNANVVMKDNEYLRTLNTKNMQELELLRKSNATLSAELTKLTTQYKQTEAGYAQLTRQTRQTRQQLSEAEQRARSYQNASELLQKERDGQRLALGCALRRTSEEGEGASGVCAENHRTGSCTCQAEKRA